MDGGYAAALSAPLDHATGLAAVWTVAFAAVDSLADEIDLAASRTDQGDVVAFPVFFRPQVLRVQVPALHEGSIEGTGLVSMENGSVMVPSRSAERGAIGRGQRGDRPMSVLTFDTSIREPSSSWFSYLRLLAIRTPVIPV